MPDEKEKFRTDDPDCVGKQLPPGTLPAVPHGVPYPLDKSLYILSPPVLD